MKEIDDHKKADLERVLCDNYICMDRGDYPRCYLDIYRNCQNYIALKAVEREKHGGN